jgi:hypothetical protein
MGYAAIATTAISAASSIMSASAASAAGGAQARGLVAQGDALRYQIPQVEQDITDTQIQVDQQENQRTLTLQKLLATNTAEAGGRGITADSGSLAAINARSADTTAIDMSRVAYMGGMRTARDRMQIAGLTQGAAGYDQAARDAIAAGQTNAWGAIAKGVMGMASSMGGMSLGGGGGMTSTQMGGPTGTGGLG